MYNRVTVLIVIQLLLSRSALGVLGFGVYLFARFLFNSSLRKKAVSFFSLLILSLMFYLLFTKVPYLQHTRIGTLLYSAQINPMNLIYTDGSIADRLSHVLVSFASLFHNYGMGFGLATWDDHANYIASHSGSFIFNVTNVHFSLGRIMSAWGTVVYELGVFGLLFLLSFIRLMRKGIKKVDRDMKFVYKVSLATIFFIMLMSVPLAFPLFGFLIGVFVHIQLKEKKTAINEKFAV